jgi:predicted secreted protein
MARLKGQNFRVLIYDETASKYKCIGMSTSCTINLTANVDESSTKDDVGGSSKPEVTSLAWSVSVESLNVVDAAAILTTFKAMEPVTLMWDETGTTNNQAPENTAAARHGQAFLNDLTLNFNDRENSAKSLQFTGASPLETFTTDPAYEAIAVSNTYTKGQFVRLYVSPSAMVNKVIGGAKTLSLHCSLSLEDATTKDTEGSWQVQEPTGYSYDISSNALYKSNETITSTVGEQTFDTLQEYYENKTLVYWKIANAGGDNNRTPSTTIASGMARITNLTLNAPNRQVATYDSSFAGYGDFTVGA